MKNIILEEKYVLEYIKSIISDCSLKSYEIRDARYHHNTTYDDCKSVIENGILSLNELNNRGIKKFTKEQLRLMSDTDSHINGIDGISLSVVGLTDLYRDEDEYIPNNELMVDFIISSSIKACRYSMHYGNEFIAENHIDTTDIRALDIRILKLISRFEEDLYDGRKLEDIIKKFNILSDITNSMKLCKSNIILRENSKNNNTMLDTNKLSMTPKILLKR